MATYLGMTAALAAVFLGLYTFFDLREGGRASNLLTTKTQSVDWFVSKFGAGFTYGSIALNVLLAAMSAVLITLAVANFRRQRAMGGAACSAAATMILGFSVFGCPGCIMPLAGTLGVAFFANALPMRGLEFKLVALLIVALTLVWTVRRLDRTPAAEMTHPRLLRPAVEA